jgi:hypothetical protein
VRPEAPTAAEATGERCDPKAEVSNVYVVDLPPERRSDLELALGNENLAVVSFSCDQLKVLKTCRAVGRYEFRGTSPKERVLSLESGDQIRAALPLGGAGIAATFEASASTGTKFDLGLVIVGQQIGSAPSFSRAELTGMCEGATHVVTGAKLGAFAMGTSAKAELKSAAELFGAGVGASSMASKLAKSRDGSLEACAAASTTDTTPPKHCDALLALELTKLGESMQAVEVHPLLQLTYGTEACTDLSTCENECNAGTGKKCKEAGIALLLGTNGVDKNVPRATELLKKGCSLDDARSCSVLAYLLFYAGELSGSNEARAEESVPFAKKGCEISQDIEACHVLGLYHEQRKEPAEAVKAFDKACAGELAYQSGPKKVFRPPTGSCEKEAAIRAAHPELPGF